MEIRRLGEIFVISNMYPNEKYPYYGVFVSEFCKQLEMIGIPYKLSVMHKGENGLDKFWRYFKFYCLTTIRLIFSRYEKIYVHYASHSSVPVLLANKVRKKAIYVNLHGSDVVPENLQQDRMQKYTRSILKIAERIIVPSQYFKDYVSAKYKIDKKKIFVYPSGGVNPDIFQRAPEETIIQLREKYGFDKNCPVFGMAGRITKDKGWDVFLKAIRNLTDDGIKAYYIIVGDGNEENTMEKMIFALGLSEIVQRVGMLPQAELAAYYSLFDFFVFPTKREGESLGLVAIEAMSCGTPVISSDFAAPGCYVENGINGFKFSVGKHVALAGCMKKACQIFGSTDYQRMIDGARETAEKFYPKAILDTLERIFM